MVIIEGRGAARVLRRAGYAVTRWAPLGDPARPDLLLPLDQPSAARYAIERWIVPETRVKQLRNRAVVALATRGAWPPPAPIVTIATKPEGRASLLTAAGSAGVEAGELFVSLGGADDLARGVAHLFKEGEPAPDWVLKFARAPGYTRPFDLDERGLALAAEIGGRVAEHAPRLVGRFQVQGMEASIETAARGMRMVNFLKAPGARAPKLAAVERVAEWIVDIGSETRGTPETLDAERKRLRDEVLPAWTHMGVRSSLVDELPPLPSVMRRGDLGAWNLVVDDDDFTAVDWETAHRGGFPVWDLLYFLTDALAHLEGASRDDGRDEFARALFRGEQRSSPVLFRWVRRGVEALSLPADAVGPIATLCWLSVGLAHVRRGETARAIRPGAEVQIPPAERIAPLWMADPLLGPSWDRWKTGRSGAA
jgi:hypothetical protein